MMRAALMAIAPLVLRKAMRSNLTDTELSGVVAAGVPTLTL
jgi:hypothetical protein